MEGKRIRYGRDIIQFGVFFSGQKKRFIALLNNNSLKQIPTGDCNASDFFCPLPNCYSN